MRNRYKISNSKELRETIEDVVNSDDIEPRTKTIIIELAQNMLTHSRGGIIDYRDNKKILAIHPHVKEIDIRTLERNIYKCSHCDVRNMNGLGFFLMRLDNWDFRLKKMNDILVIQITKDDKKNTKKD